MSHSELADTTQHSREPETTSNYPPPLFLFLTLPFLPAIISPVLQHSSLQVLWRAQIRCSDGRIASQLRVGWLSCSGNSILTPAFS